MRREPKPKSYMNRAEVLTFLEENNGAHVTWDAAVSRWGVLRNPDGSFVSAIHPAATKAVVRQLTWLRLATWGR